MQFYCPVCFAEIAGDQQDAPCLVCGAVLAEWRQRDYTDRLIHALRHPNPEVRIGAIISLGNRREPRAAVPLAECALAHPIDVVQALAIVAALRTISPSSERDQALELLAGHPARAVRRAVAGKEVER
jgi:HEAT repeat protein